MIDILTGRCTLHGWLSDKEHAGGYCLRCEFPEDYEDDNPDYPDEDWDDDE